MDRHIRLGGVLLGLVLLTTACLPQGVRLPQSEFLGLLARKSGLIAYLGADGNVYTVDQGGGKPQPITTDASIGDSYRVYGLPSWARDAQSLAFAAYVGQGQDDPTQTSLMVARKDGSGLNEIYASEDFLIYYYWSPDSQRIGLISDTPGSALALKLVPSAGGEAQTVDVGQPYYWTWAADSRALLVHAGDNSTGGPSRLALLRLDGGVTEQGLAVTPSLFKAPAFSPDGTQALVAGQVDGKSALLLTDAAGKVARTVADYTGNIAFAWSPDGKRAAYIASEAGSVGVLGPIVIVDPAEAADPVTLEGDPAYAFFWAPDSQSIAYFSPHQVATETPTPAAGAIDSTSSDIVWSLSVANTRSGASRSIATFVPTDRFLQLLPYFDQYHQSVTIWSPDSQNLVVSAYGSDSQPGIWVVAASGSLEPRPVAPGLIAVWSWQ